MKFAVSVVLFFALAAQRPPVVLSDLTVPHDRLPETCIPLSTPWLGTQPSQLASIRRSFGPVSPMPDRSSNDVGSPPPTRGLDVADGIDAGYEATYGTSAGKALLRVYALRFRSAGEAKTFWGNSRVFRSPNSAVMGPIVAYVAGDKGECRDAVVAYVKSLER